MSDAVLYEVNDGVAVITFNRPDRLNAWNGDIHQGYFTSLDNAAADPEVQVIVVTGAGRGWCAGADMDVLQGIQSDAPSDSAGAMAQPTWNHTHAMTLPKPVIAAIMGRAPGSASFMRWRAIFASPPTAPSSRRRSVGAA